jgi:hypothetical protein
VWQAPAAGAMAVVDEMPQLHNAVNAARAFAT